MAKVIFFGTPLFARQVLEIVNLKHQILAIVTQPDRPFGRKQELRASEVKEYALKHKIPLFQPQKLDDHLLQDLKHFKADFFLVVAFGQIFPTIFLEYLPCINIHASILPHLRGASPLHEMILQDRKEYGVTAMKMEDGLDCGDILGISILNTQEDLSLSDLATKMANLGGNLANRVLHDFSSIAPLKQNHCDASVCKKIKKEHGEVDFSDARKIFVKYLAFSLWPSIFLHNGLKLLKISLLSKEGKYPQGEILEIQKDGIIVGCQKGKIKILEVQPPSKQKIKAIDYLHGKRLSVGEVFC